MHSRSPVVLIICIIFIIASFVIPQQTEAQVIAENNIERKGITAITWTQLYGKEYHYIPDEDLSGIGGNSPTDIYAVGDDGKIIHYDGAKWSQLPKLTNKTLNAVWVSGINIYAVGNDGTIIHNGSVDRSLPPTKADLNAVWGTCAKDDISKINVIAVGNGGTILHFNGEEWSQLGSPTTNHLKGVWGSSINNIFAVGEGGTAIHFNDKKFPKTPTEENLNAVWGTFQKDDMCKTNVFAVGNGGTIVHFNGTEWSKMDSHTKNNLNGIQGISPVDIYAVGDSATLLHYDGNGWFPVKASKDKSDGEDSYPPKLLPAFIKNKNLKSIWISSNPHIFIIGEGGIIVGGIYQGAYWLGGYIRDLVSGSGISGAEVYVQVNGNWESQPRRRAGSSGLFEDISFSGAIQTLMFCADNYKTEAGTITLQPNSKININNYLIPDNGTYSIAGIITKTCQSYDCPLGGVAVKLYKDNGDYTFPPPPVKTTNTDSKGRYSFSSLQQGIYKVEPSAPGCNPFTPGYVQIPQNVPPSAFDFTGICQ